MTVETQRWITESVLAIAGVVFGLWLVWRAYRRHGLHWPPTWDAVAGQYLVAQGIAWGLHAAFWVGWIDSLASWWTLAALWVAAFMAGWALWRWVREDDGDITGAGHD
jgi:hypothetical protein